MKTTLNRITISPENETKLADWLLTRGGIAVWSSKDLGSSALGSQTFTPADNLTAPHWSCGQTPDFIVTDSAAVSVETAKEVARVKIRNGPPYLGCVNRADKPRLDAALEKAGQCAYYVRDYSNTKYGSAWFEAVIMVPDSIRQMNLWILPVKAE